jgi:hypothetical protein
MASSRISLALLLLAALGCKDKKKSEPQPAAGEKAVPAVPPSPASEPDLPDPLRLDCAAIVPEAVRAAHFPGFAVEPTIEGPIATCLFTDGKVRPSVSLFCHRRKRNWNFADELARDPRKTAIAKLGRGGYSRRDHVFFYPSKLDCLARVIWPDDPGKGAAVARALDPHLSRSTVQP